MYGTSKVFKSAYNNLSHQQPLSTSNNQANTPKDGVIRTRNQFESAKHIINAHNIFYDTNFQDSTNILEVETVKN